MKDKPKIEDTNSQIDILLTVYRILVILFLPLEFKLFYYRIFCVVQISKKFSRIFLIKIQIHNQENHIEMDEKPQQPPSKQKQSSHNKPQQPQNQIQIPSWQSKAFEEWVKTLLMQDIVDSGISVLELYCGKGMDIGKWHRSQISSYVGLETNKNHLDASKQRWNEKGKPFEAEFMNLDPLNSNFVDQLPTTKRQFNVICCFQGLGNSFETQEKVTNLLKNVSNLLKSKGIFFLE